MERISQEEYIKKLKELANSCSGSLVKVTQSENGQEHIVFDVTREECKEITGN